MSLRNYISILLLIIILVLFAYGLFEYKGNIVYYILFSLISNFSLFYGFRKNSLFFDNFFGLLIWLGFWFKFTVQIVLMNSMFPEGAGTFDFKPNSYDNVLTLSSIGIAGFIFGSFLREQFYIYKALEVKNIFFLNFYFNNRKIILILFFLIIFIFAILNFIFYIYQKGTIPLIVLPFKLNNIFGWMLTFGFASFSSLIIYFEFISNKKFKCSAIFFGLIEVFISSISLLSRAMIFNGFSLLFGFYRSKEIFEEKINKKKITVYFLFLIILFFISLILVSKIRQARDFPIGHEVHSYIPTISTSNEVLEETVEEVNKILLDVNQILFLIAGRWVGIEGIMSVYSFSDKGLQFFLDSFNETFNYHNSYYENKVKKSYHTYDKEVQIYTVYTPGLFAYLYYGGSKIFLFLGVFFMTLLASFIEFIAFKFSRNNLIFASLIGNVIAYRFAHFGYMPANSYKLITAILITIFLISLIMNYKFRKNK